MSTYLDKAFSPVELGKLKLRNRIIKAATFEGKTPGGVPGDALLDFHKPICDGGIGMTTIAYCAAEADGRVNGNMTYMDERFRPQLSHIVSELQQSGARVSGQLSHCGHFSKNRDLQRLKRPLGPSPHFNILGSPSFMT
jgi:2,4-dienoyl-CoA reductase-like NADH-dependent reductase (Old Yellow Enzyme family)